MTFDESVNNILHENYFGGSPHERMSGIKRHVTFEDADEESKDILQDPEKYMSKLATQRRQIEKQYDSTRISEQGQQLLAIMKYLDEQYSIGGGVGTGSKVKRVLASELKSLFFQAEYGTQDIDNLEDIIFDLLEDKGMDLIPSEDDDVEDIQDKTNKLTEAKLIAQELQEFAFIPSNKDVRIKHNKDASYRGNFVYEYPVANVIDQRDWEPGMGGSTYDDNGFKIRVVSDRSLGEDITLKDIEEDAVMTAQVLAPHSSPRIPESLILDLKVSYKF